MDIALPDLAATIQLATEIAGLLRPGDSLLLQGPLGVGKTAFARALLRAMTGDASLEVPSPTYTLVQTYQARTCRVHHFDLWRLDGPASLAELGWDEMQEDVVIVEWPDRLGHLRPARALSVNLAMTGPDGRRATLTTEPQGERFGLPLPGRSASP